MLQSLAKRIGGSAAAAALASTPNAADTTATSGVRFDLDSSVAQSVAPVDPENDEAAHEKAHEAPEKATDAEAQSEAADEDGGAVASNADEASAMADVSVATSTASRSKKNVPPPSSKMPLKSALKTTKKTTGSVYKKGGSSGGTGGSKRAPESHEKKPHRTRPGTVALREIRKYQKSVDPSLTLKAVTSLARHFALVHAPTAGIRMRPDAIRIIRDMLEDHLVRFLVTSMLVSVHAQRKSLYEKDMSLTAHIYDLKTKIN